MHEHHEDRMKTRQTHVHNAGQHIICRRGNITFDLKDILRRLGGWLIGRFVATESASPWFDLFVSREGGQKVTHTLFICPIKNCSTNFFPAPPLRANVSGMLGAAEDRERATATGVAAHMDGGWDVDGVGDEGWTGAGD